MPNSPLRGAGRKPMTVGDVGDLDESHVRFQDSDLGILLQINTCKINFAGELGKVFYK